MKKIDIFVLFCLLIFSILLYSFTYDRGISLHDEGRDVDAFVKILDGKMVYRDFRWVHGPSALYLHSLVFKLCGINLLYIRQFLIVVALLVMLLSYILARFILPPIYSGIAALLSIGFYGFPQYTSDHIYGTLFGLVAAMYTLKYFIQQKKTIYLYLSGISTGLVFGFIHPIGVQVYLAIALYIVLMSKNIKLLFQYTIYTALSVIIIYLYFLVNVPWNILYENLNPLWKLKNFTHVNNNLPSILSIFPGDLSAASFNLWRIALLIWMPVIFTGTVFVVLFYRFHKEKFDSVENKVLLLFVVYQPIMLLKLFLDKGIEGIVFYAQVGMILAVYTSYLLIQNLNKNRLIFFAPLKFLIIICLGLLYLVEIVPFSIAHYYGFKSDYKLQFERATVYVNSKIGETIVDTVEYIKNNTAKSDKVIFADYYPMFNFLTDRDNPLYDNEMTPGVFRDITMENDAIETIKSSGVKYFVFVRPTFGPEKAEGWGPYVFGKTYAVSLVNYIKENYHIEKEFGDISYPPSSLKVILYRRNY